MADVKSAVKSLVVKKRLQDFQKKAFGFKNVELVGKKLYADTTMNKAQLSALREFFKKLEE